MRDLRRIAQLDKCPKKFGYGPYRRRRLTVVIASTLISAHLYFVLGETPRNLPFLCGEEIWSPIQCNVSWVHTSLSANGILISLAVSAQLTHVPNSPTRTRRRQMRATCVGKGRIYSLLADDAVQRGIYKQGC